MVHVRRLREISAAITWSKSHWFQNTELNSESWFISPVDAAPHCGQIESLWGGRLGLIRFREVFTKLHKASRSFGEGLLLGQIQFSNTPKRRSFRLKKKCSGTLFDYSDFVWFCWFGLPRDADVTLLSERPTDHGTFCSTPFLSRLVASIIRCRA